MGFPPATQLKKRSRSGDGRDVPHDEDAGRFALDVLRTRADRARAKRGGAGGVPQALFV